MRLVDIFFKNINGQLSEAKGNLNIVGHLMMYHSAYTNSDFFRGYFEIDGSTIKNAHTNYSDLYKVLSGDGSPIGTKMAVAMGTDIHLNNKPALISVKALSGGFSGKYIPPQTQTHTHNYWQGEQVYEPTSSTPTQKEPAFYSMRFFIYHGVHT